MRMQPFSVRCRSVLSILAVVLLAAGMAVSQEAAIWSFYSADGDALPIGGLTADGNGNLYGVTFYGGVYGNGMVYRLSPTASGWQETVLYSFNPGTSDGWGPTSAPVLAPNGTIYGSTEFGGTGDCTNGFGCGTIYELTPVASGAYKETIIHDFVGTDGWQIHPGVILDGSGNLYGMATNGGTYKNGTLFQLAPSPGGSWSLNVLHQFTGGKDGGVPFDALTMDAAGNLYGTTSAGGGKSAACRYGCGLVFEFSQSGGAWTEKILHNFTTNANDGHTPACQLTFDAAGNLYGTTSSGGGPGLSAGIVFELTPNAKGTWTEIVLHNFNEKAGDGNGPSNSVMFDAAGNLYGATIGGGKRGRGTAFELSPTAGGSWNETLLYNFSSVGPGGYFPNSGLISVGGNLYGIAASGGRNDQGTVYEVTP